jgi:hypothetical protein
VKTECSRRRVIEEIDLHPKMRRRLGGRRDGDAARAVLISYLDRLFTHAR